MQRFLVTTLILLAAAILPASALAGPNGYWDFRTVCDYETVTEETEVTYCIYSGSLTAWGPNSNKLYTRHFSEVQGEEGHVECQASVWVWKNTWETYYADGEWQSEWVDFDGYLPLQETRHEVETETRQEVVPGSCRTERVWVPCEFDCSIP